MKATLLPQENTYLQEPSLQIQRVVNQSWVNIPHHWVHVNIDASLIDIETKTSVAGIIRDKHGLCCLIFYCLSYASNLLHAELLAIRQGLHMANDGGTLILLSTRIVNKRLTWSLTEQI